MSEVGHGIGHLPSDFSAAGSGRAERRELVAVAGYVSVHIDWIPFLN